MLEVGHAGFDNDEVLEIKNALKLLQRHVHDEADTAGERFQEPDMRNRGSQLDHAHALAAHLGQRDFDAAFFADNTFVFHALVLAAKTFIVLHGAEDAGAEQTVFFRLERPVIDGFRLFDLAERPRLDLFRAGDRNPDAVERLRPRRLAE